MELLPAKAFFGRTSVVTITCPSSGDVYEGEHKAGLPDGRGVLRLANGDVHDGEWKAGKMEGRGVYRYASGDVESGFYKRGADVGEGVGWLADGRRAARLRDGKWEEEISLEEARRTAERLGLLIPSPLPADANVYEGERNAADEPEGRGVMQYTNGDVYEGEFKAGEFEGRGVFRLANGDVHDGEWKAGKMEGRGVYRYASGDVESGFYKQGADVGEGVRWTADGRWAGRLRDGKWEEEISLEEARRTAERLGLLIPSPLPADANVYEGERNAADEPEGRGVIRYANGDVYEGEHKAGEFEGRGVLRLANGNVHDGEWKAGKMEGRGVQQLANGNLMSSFCKQGAPVGEGVGWLADGRRAGRLRDGKKEEDISLEEARQTAERLGLLIPSPLPADGNVYEGERNEAGEAEGRGVMRFANGDVYDGEHKAGLPDGRGVMRFANGDVYEGVFKAGEMAGRGVMKYANGNVYEGERNEAGEAEGRGVYRFADGTVYDGEWKAGKKEGRGVFRWADGDVDAVFFKQCAPVGEGVGWLADGQGAVRLRDGETEEDISLEEARRTAERLGLPIPSPLPGA